ncbi:uncharacterized protein CcaverHIS019_0408470 [Cutaneotrichosporon cavernicola]|uniref:Cyclin-like domain-containing protein n=1 Tax=Cutaneotrichosporon cavernicola TaxID=279322 RepID=A0AA48QWC6_9TREE|nr:uncharacterized protein CcaverHIS019_0408470 [Cutaneotrichosporon cavernicola]BEI92027.1 hypothetical protein CcaverHIS019_0408470 [Cutaneotrichosporon cavernicola]
MSSNFYTSTHAKYWLLTRAELHASRETDLRYATPHQRYCLNIFFASLIQKLGKRLLLRQTPIATAVVYFRRFYARNSICETNPYLVLAACIFVAAKVEETPVHIKSVVAEAKVVFGEHNIKMFPAEPSKLGEMEFYLLEDICFCLVVFHPYRALVNICGREPADAGRFPKTRAEEDADVRRKEAEAARKRSDEAKAKGPPGSAARMPVEDEGGEGEAERIRRLMGRGSGEGLMEVEEGALQIAWFVINDSFRTDAPLLYPPYIVALAALYIAFTLTSSSGTSARSTRSSTQVGTITQAIESNAALGLPPPPSGAAEFLASFQVSLPTLFACVQDITCLYPIWEAFEPSPTRPGQQPAQGKGPKFTPEDAEALVRRMIEERMVDLGHPDDAGAGAEEPPKKRLRT